MRNLIFLFLLISTISTAQTINLCVGTTFIPDKIVGDYQYNNNPRPFITLGIGYTSESNFSVSITKTLDIDYMFNIQSVIPLINVQNKRKRRWRVN